VPTSFSGISSGAAGAGAGVDGMATGAGGITKGGRREGEKIGRSRVAVSELKGTPQSGLPLDGGAPTG
jgi:hypothetical protein